MTQLVLNIEDTSLIPSLERILGAIKGVTIGKRIDEDAEKQFITTTITQGYREAQEGHFAGKGLSSLDILVNELRAEA